MTSPGNVFFEMPCLIEKSQSLSGFLLSKKWFKGADRRYLAESLQKFVEYNKELFDFLEVTPRIEGSGKSVSLNFRSDRFIGAIPLRAPDTGKQIGDFVVRPRYTSANDQFSEYVEIVKLLVKWTEIAFGSAKRHMHVNSKVPINYWLWFIGEPVFGLLKGPFQEPFAHWNY